MKTIRVFGLALVAVLALAGISASGAMAYEWQVNGAALTKAATVAGESTITFGLEGSSVYSCAISRKGTVGPGAAGEITSITSPSGAKAIPCTILKEGGWECASHVEIEAAGLPWHTEINSESRNVLTASQNWKVKCKSSVNEAMTNLCVVPKSTALVNSAGGVEQAYDSHSEHTSCFAGLNFAMSGVEQLKASSGMLSVSTPGTKVPWLLAHNPLSESIPATWKGKLSVLDSEDLGIECEDTIEGTAWPYYGGGRITKLTTSNCKSIQACSNSMSIEALGLPWNTELVSEGSDQDRIVGTGNGTPGFKLSCTALGSKVTEECTGTLRAEATNGVGGVTAVFDDPEKLTCTLVGYKGKLAATLTGTQSITSSHGTLEV